MPGRPANSVTPMRVRKAGTRAVEAMSGPTPDGEITVMATGIADFQSRNPVIRAIIASITAPSNSPTTRFFFSIDSSREASGSGDSVS